MQKEVAILGAGGLTGRELLRCLRYHPNLRASFITSDLYANKKLDSVFREFSEDTHLTFRSNDISPPSGLPIFLCTPNDKSMELLPKFLDKGHEVVDLSGAFRLNHQKTWENVYGMSHSTFEYTPKVVFGLPEIFRDNIKVAKAVANPGCYPTSVIWPIWVLGALRNQIQSISITSSSGVSGAGGRIENGGFPFTNVYENYRAYKILSHQHEPEIELYSKWNLNDENQKFSLCFIPHLLPLYRGILSTITIHWKETSTPSKADLKKLYTDASSKEVFIRFYERPEEIELINVQNTNYLDFSYIHREHTTIIITAIDNLIKGAAGQAIQNMNLMLGFAESSGLLT